MRRWVIPALVLGLHLLLLGLQWGLRRANEKPMALPERIEFFLPPLVRQRPPPKEDKKNARRPTEINRTKVVADTQSPTVDEALPAIATAASPAPADAPRARLILSLPPLAASAPRNPALTDARTNTARLTLEEKMAQALDGTVHLQLQADGTTIRRRVGNQCVDLHESRAVKLMPDVDFLRFAPVAAGRTYDCK